MRKSWQKVAVRLACVLGVSCLALTGMPARVWAAAAPGTYILNRSAVVLPVGSAFLSTSTGVVELSVSHLVNHALNGRSGDLRLLVYLTKTRYTGEGSIRGSVIAQKDFASLPGGGVTMFKNDKLWLNVNHYPASGRYYLSVVLTEFCGDDYYVTDFYTTPGTVLVPEHPVVKQNEFAKAAAGILQATAEALAEQNANNNNTAGASGSGAAVGQAEPGGSTDVATLQLHLQRAYDQLNRDQNALYNAQQRHSATVSRGRSDFSGIQNIRLLRQAVQRDQQLIANLQHRIATS